MAQQHKITICCGTYCYIMGGAELYTLDEDLPAEISNLIEVKRSTCMGYCQGDHNNAPHTELDGKLLPKASVASIIAKIQEKEATA